NLASSESNNDYPSVPCNALQALVDHAEGVENDVDAALAGGEVADSLLPVGFAIKNKIRAVLLADSSLLVRIGSGDNLQAEGLTDLDSSKTQTTSSAVNKDVFA